MLLDVSVSVKKQIQKSYNKYNDNYIDLSTTIYLSVLIMIIDEITAHSTLNDNQLLKQSMISSSPSNANLF
jgi:hypothetical protein